jgi:hypothetical protein
LGGASNVSALLTGCVTSSESGPSAGDDCRGKSIENAKPVCEVNVAMQIGMRTGFGVYMGTDQAEPLVTQTYNSKELNTCELAPKKKAKP